MTVLELAEKMPWNTTLEVVRITNIGELYHYCTQSAREYIAASKMEESVESKCARRCINDVIDHLNFGAITYTYPAEGRVVATIKVIAYTRKKL